MIPKLYMSAFSVHRSFVSTSGAAQANVPANDEDLERFAHSNRSWT